MELSDVEPLIEAMPPEVGEQLGFYVYLYLDPRKSPPAPFYVGKGKGRRVIDHVNEAGTAKKHQVLRELREQGLVPRIELLAHRLPNEEMAFRIEAAVLDLLGLDRLTNRVRGSKSLELGRIPLSEAIAQYAAAPVEVVDPVIAFMLNELFRPHMSDEELYEATRGVWNASGARRAVAHYAFAVFQGVVREVYTIDAWEPSDPAAYRTRTGVPTHNKKGQQLWQFVGGKAGKDIRDRYVMRSISSYRRRGDQSGFRYLP